MGTYSAIVHARTLELNMKLIVALCLVTVVAAATPPRLSNDNDNIQLLRYDKDTQADGKYSFRFEQTDGQTREEEGQLNLENKSLSVKGSYHWVGPDGVEYLVTYNADENGYKPEIQQGPGGAVSPQLASLLG